MEGEEDTSRKQQFAMLYQKLNKINRDLHEDNTDDINRIIGSNNPAVCLSYLMDLEKKGDPRQDRNHLNKLVDFYTRVFANMPLGKHCQTESYARMLVRFAELKATQDVNEAEANFNIAKSHCQDFAFVHIAHAQFEYSQGHTKKSTSILQEALKLGARPTELLEAAIQNLQSGRGHPLSSEDKENISALPHKNEHDSGKNIGTEYRKVFTSSDGTCDLQLSNISCPGTDQRSGPLEDQLPVRQSVLQRQRAIGMQGRGPIVPVKRSDAFIPSLSRQTPGSSKFILSSAKKSTGHGDSGHGDSGHGDSGHGDFKKNAGDGDFNLKPPSISPEPRPWEELAMVDSTTTLMNRRDASRMEDTTYNFDQVLSSSSPEACRVYLLNMERRGDPHTDYSLLAKLKHCYFRVFTRMPLANYSRNESHARMLIRLAELKGIEDADDARDHFIMARSNSKLFAFVHIAYAQFEVSQGNVQKATSILQKAQSLNARPAELLENAMRNLRAGKSQLLPPDHSDTPTPEPQAQGAFLSSVCAAEREQEAPSRVCVSQGPQGQPKPPGREPLSGWKMPTCVSQLVSPEEKQTRGAEPIHRLLDIPTLQTTPPEPVPPRLLGSLSTPSLQTTPPEPVDSMPLPSRFNPPKVCETPSYKDPAANSFVTPVVKRIPPALAPPSAPHRAGPAQLPCTPVNQVSFSQQPPQGPVTALSKGSITIKGRQFFILKMIGRGGSSKVYQVLDHKNQLFAVKIVNLEEADAQTVESYQNEIEHLNRLQQHSEQIIKLYDYEISSSHIYMLMEWGNLDLSSWLRNRKTVNPLERKFYWKNMLEAVSTIHKHGIVHSDLKPANFVIVNASLKLIDFGIANRIQPDVTSIMKDTQVGTLNYMPPEAIKDTSSKPGKASSKISPKGDVWSMGCILYSMTYGKTPFQSITNQFAKLHAIIDPSHHIKFPDLPETDLLDVLKRCLVRNPRERISISELLEHSYLQLQHQPSSEPAPTENSELRRILSELAALNSPGSIVRAVTNLGKMCDSGRKLDVAECVKPSSQPSWKM